MLKLLEEQAVSLTIGDVARRTKCSAPTIRYYEQIGLIAPAVRGSNGRRTYGFPDIDRLRLIRRARDFGMSIDQVRSLLAAVTPSSGPCEPARSIVAARLADVVAKQAELEKLRRSLSSMLSRCDSQCDPQDECCTIFADIDRD
jgi:MerR family transcriptional regulator, copper efflux regulator